LSKKLAATYIIYISSVIASATLATLLYKLGVESSVAESTNEPFELLVEDDPVLNSSQDWLPNSQEARKRASTLDPTERKIAN